MKKEYKVAQDVAEQEFDALCEEHEIDTDLTGEDAEGFQELKGKLVRAIMRGKLVIDNGLPVYTNKAGTGLRFKEPTGATLLAMDKIKDGQDTRKVYAVLTELTSGKFKPADCTMADVKVLTAIFQLFAAG